MKKITAMIAIVFMTLNAFAQKPVKGDMGMTFGFNGLSELGVSTTTPTGTLLFRYYITDNIAARASLNFTSNSFSTDMTDDTSGTIYTTSTKSSSWAIAIGAQKSCGTIKNIEPYIGLDLYAGSGVNGKIDNMITDTSGNSFHTETVPGSTFNWGVTPVVGFNWFFADHFALGAEFGWGIGMSSTKTGETTLTNHVGSVPYVVITTHTASSKSTNIGGNASGLITFSVFFD